MESCGVLLYSTDPTPTKTVEIITIITETLFKQLKMKNIFIWFLLFWLKIVCVSCQVENISSSETTPTISMNSNKKQLFFNPNPLKEFLSTSSYKPSKSPTMNPTRQTMPEVYMSIGTLFNPDIESRGLDLFTGRDPSDQLLSTLAKTIAFTVCESMGIATICCALNDYGFLFVVPGRPVEQLTFVSVKMIDYPQYNGDVDIFKNSLETAFLNGNFYNTLVQNGLLCDFKPSFTNDSLVNVTVDNLKVLMPPTFQPTNSPVGLWSADPSDDASISKAKVVGIVIAVLIVFVFLLFGIYYLLKDLKKDARSLPSSKNVQLTSSQKSSSGAKYSTVESRAPAGTYIV